MIKKIVKAATIVVGVILLLALAVLLAVSPIAKWYILKHDTELTGRHIALDKLRINLLNGKVRLEGFKMYEADAQEVFASFKSFGAQLAYTDLFKNTIKAKYITLDSAYLQIEQDIESFNFDDIIAHFDSAEQPVDTTSASFDWSIELDKININRSEIIYHDIAVGSRFGLQDFSLEIPALYFSNQKSDVGIDLNFHRGGSLKVETEYNMGSTDYKVRLMLADFQLSSTLPYLLQQMNVGSFDGLLSTDITITGNTEHILDLDMNGTLDFANFDLRDDRGEEIFVASQVSAKIKNVNPGKGEYKIDSIRIDRGCTLFEMFADGTTNFDRLMKPSAVTENPTDSLTNVSEEPAMNFFIGDLKLIKARVAFADHTVQPSFRYTIGNIDLESENIDLNATNHVKAKASLQDGGEIRFEWRGRVDDIANQDISLTLKNIDIRDFTPYSLSYTAYPITNGVLTVSSHNVIRNYQLEGTNKLDIYQAKVGDKHKELKPEFNVPLKLGLYILKDRHDKITIDLPISGRVDSPQFSYKKLIFKTLGNLLVKVVTSPTRFMGNMLLGKDDNLDKVAFDATIPEFNSEAYYKLKQLADMVKSKPELRLILSQQINIPKAATAIAKADTSSRPIEQKQADATNLVKVMIAERDSLLGSELKGKMGLEEAMFRVATMPDSALQKYNGNNFYNVSFDLKEETQTETADEK